VLVIDLRRLELGAHLGETSASANSTGPVRAIYAARRSMNTSPEKGMSRVLSRRPAHSFTYQMRPVAFILADPIHQLRVSHEA